MTDSAINVDADLTIRAGTAEGHLSGSGCHLRFTATDLTPFLSSAPSADANVVRRATTRIAEAGMSISVVEAGDTILDVGDVEPSLIAQMFGFRNVRIRRPFRLLARYLKR